MTETVNNYQSGWQQISTNRWGFNLKVIWLAAAGVNLVLNTVRSD